MLRWKASMATNLERRIDALEAVDINTKSAANLTDRELLAIVAPHYAGPMPSSEELPAMIHAWLMNAPPALPPADGLTGQERYMRMLNGPNEGSKRGDR